MKQEPIKNQIEDFFSSIESQSIRSKNKDEKEFSKTFLRGARESLKIAKIKHKIK